MVVLALAVSCAVTEGAEDASEALPTTAGDVAEAVLVVAVVAEVAEETGSIAFSFMGIFARFTSYYGEIGKFFSLICKNLL
jgi:hypothetical protein